ncbi:hypothetical protein RR42_s3324 [Cupriavidus basilensis]|uniref:Uncharacterized protein n=1 Tax=Cupriavidus basilensis TaxID=68895 RepID=A0A0C4YR02_9BURK|nr:hypothetical protein RR42_s3324 [Cupriavidus basilensis]
MATLVAVGIRHLVHFRLADWGMDQGMDWWTSIRTAPLA